MAFSFSGLVGIPWLDKGRDANGIDCWGLFMKAFWEGLGIRLPSYSDAYATAADAKALSVLINGERGPWRPVEPACAMPFDGVLMLEGRYPRHVGVVTRPGWMLHIPIGGESVIEPYTTARHARRVEGLYRHESRL